MLGSARLLPSNLPQHNTRSSATVPDNKDYGTFFTFYELRHLLAEDDLYCTEVLAPSDDDDSVTPTSRYRVYANETSAVVRAPPPIIRASSWNSAYLTQGRHQDNEPIGVRRTRLRNIDEPC